MGTKSASVRLAIQFQLILLVYLLSTGPMYWRIHAAYNFRGSPFVAQLYYPVVKGCEASETFSDVLDWYAGLWVYGDLDERELPPICRDPAVQTADARP